jgi:hypothetical protein
MINGVACLRLMQQCDSRLPLTAGIIARRGRIALGPRGNKGPRRMTGLDRLISLRQPVRGRMPCHDSGRISHPFSRSTTPTNTIGLWRNTMHKVLIARTAGQCQASHTKWKPLITNDPWIMGNSIPPSATDYAIWSGGDRSAGSMEYHSDLQPNLHIV